MAFALPRAGGAVLVERFVQEETSGADARYAASQRRDISSVSDQLPWRRSTRCSANSCVEVASLPGGEMAVRDGKSATSPVLIFSAEEWTSFVSGVKAGEFG